MSKLVKLSTTLDTNRDTNGYLCISDNDIILKEDSKVSLLNAHLSSGIVTDYKINGTDSDNTVAQGKKILDLNLNDNVGDRPVIIPNGNYDISGLMQNIQDGLNRAAVFNSTTYYATQAIAKLVVPTDQGFGLSHAVGLDADKVKISYNSMPQKYDVDLGYSIKDPSIQVAADGTVSHPGLPPADTLQLIEAEAAQRLVVSVGNAVAAGFGVNDTCLLVSIDRTRTVQAKITSVAIKANNLSSNIAVAPYPNANLPITRFKSVNPYSGNALNVNDDVTLDDGTGVFGTASPKQVTAKVDTVTYPYSNPSINVNLLDAAVINTEDSAIFSIAATALSDGADDVTVDGQVSKKYPVKITGLPANNEASELNNLGFANGFYVFTREATGRYVYLGLISNRQITAGSGEATMDITCITIDPNDGHNKDYINTLVSAQNFRGPDTFITSIFQPNMQVGICNFDEDFFGGSVLESIVLDTTGVSTIYTLKPQFVTTDEKDFEAFVLIWRAFFENAGYTDGKMPNLFLNAYNCYRTDQPTTLTQFTANFNTGDTIVIKSFENISNFVGVITEVDIGTNKFVIFTLDTPYTNFDEIYQYFSQILASPANEMVKNSFDRDILITLKNLSGAIDPAVNRLWEGTGIVLTSSINLSGFQGNLQLNAFNLLIRGTNILPQSMAYAIEDNILSHSSGRCQWFVKTVGECEFGIIPDGTGLGSGLDICPIRIKVVPVGGGTFKYQILYIDKTGRQREFVKNTAQGITLGQMPALDGDYIIMQWGVTPSTDDYEFISKPPSINSADGNFPANAAPSTGLNHSLDKNKVLISIIRSTWNGNSATNLWVYFGSPIDQAGTLILNQNTIRDIKNKCRLIPWTPRSDPYIEPILWDNQNSYHVYITPNQAEIQTIELSPTAKFTTLADGSIVPLAGNSFIYHPDMHNTDNLDADYSLTKYNSLTNSYKLSFVDPEIQKLLGYKLNSITLTGLTNSWNANLDYLRAYLPEGIIILLENISCETYDLGQFNGSRRNIIATAIDTQSKAGEVSIEPSNLYRIAIGNKAPINLRKFALAFEDLNGNRLLLANSKVTVCLLFE